MVVLMLSHFVATNHFLTLRSSVIRLNTALVSLYGLLARQDAMNIPLMRVDGFAMLYTGLVLLASLATCTFATVA
ncbi:hypothetical protein ACNKHV_14455 [Shigella flexneri]